MPPAIPGLSRSPVPALLLLVVLAIAAVIFWPALSGPFVLDDESNLKRLGYNGGIDSLQDFFTFIFTGEASRLGRPVSLASFVLNARDWPALAWPFKFTNLMLHLLNGLLVFLFTQHLLRLIDKDANRGRWVALLAMSLWLLHPLQLSTMMTVVQRMTQLSAMFTLIGALAYLHGRSMVAQTPYRGYTWMSLGVGAGGILAVLSKENGVLLPLFIVVIEATLASAVKPPLRRWWKVLFLALPMLLLVAYVSYKWPAFMELYAEKRPFDLGERLLSQARALTDYLGYIFMPWRPGMGVFHDDFAVSNGLLSPPSTLLALVFLALLAALGVTLRHRQPVLAFAILWYFAGHLLESTVIPLELYFEHRNYLPMVGWCVAAGYYLVRYTRPAVIVCAVGFVAAEAVYSLQSSVVWGNHAVLARTWVEQHPQSLRAAQFHAQHLARQGDNLGARKQLEATVRFNPERLAPRLQILQFACTANDLGRDDIESLIGFVPSAAHDHGAANVLPHLGRFVSEGRCPALNYSDLHRIADAMLANPAWQHSKKGLRTLLWQKSQLYLWQDDLDAALATADRAYAIVPDYQIPLNQASWLMVNGRYDEAMKYAAVAERTPAALGASHQEQVQRLKLAIARHREQAGKEPAPPPTPAA